MRELGQTLNVDYIVEGSVRRAANRIRVSVNLVEAHSGNQKWADRFDREIEDIFDLQDEVTELIVARLEPEIGFAERSRVAFVRPSNLQAWDCFHLGIYHFYKFTGPDNLQAQEMLLRSQDLDNNFGEAYAWWAYAVVLGMVYWDVEPSSALLDKALWACNKALSFDSRNATFYALKARVLLARKEYDAAIFENEMAIKINPTLATAFCGLGDSLAYEGRYDESLDCFDKAIALSPNDPQLWAFYTYGALVQLFKKDFLKALQWTERASRIPNYQYWTTAHKIVAMAYLSQDPADDQDRHAELVIAKAQLLQEFPGFCCDFARTKLFYLKKQEQIDLYINGLRLAGIAELA